jgi:hypothetical protein
MTTTQAPISDPLTPGGEDYADYVRLDVTKYISSFLYPVESDDEFVLTKRRVRRAIQIYELYIGLHYSIEVQDATVSNFTIRVPKTRFREARIICYS